MPIGRASTQVTISAAKDSTQRQPQPVADHLGHRPPPLHGVAEVALTIRLIHLPYCT